MSDKRYPNLERLVNESPSLGWQFDGATRGKAIGELSELRAELDAFRHQHYIACNISDRAPIGSPGCICVITCKSDMAHQDAEISRIDALRIAAEKQVLVLTAKLNTMTKLNDGSVERFKKAEAEGEPLSFQLWWESVQDDIETDTQASLYSLARRAFDAARRALDGGQS